MQSRARARYEACAAAADAALRTEFVTQEALRYEFIVHANVYGNWLAFVPSLLGALLFAWLARAEHTPFALAVGLLLAPLGAYARRRYQRDWGRVARWASYRKRHYDCALRDAYGPHKQFEMVQDRAVFGGKAASARNGFH